MPTKLVTCGCATLVISDFFTWREGEQFDVFCFDHWDFSSTPLAEERPARSLTGVKKCRFWFVFLCCIGWDWNIHMFTSLSFLASTLPQCDANIPHLSWSWARGQTSLIIHKTSNFTCISSTWTNCSCELHGTASSSHTQCNTWIYFTTLDGIWSVRLVDVIDW